MPASCTEVGCDPGSVEITVGSPRNGASLAAAANFEENSPKTKCCERSSINPNVAMSQNAVEPPLPSTTS